MQRINVIVAFFPLSLNFLYPWRPRPSLQTTNVKFRILKGGFQNSNWNTLRVKRINSKKERFSCKFLRVRSKQKKKEAVAQKIKKFPALTGLRMSHRNNMTGYGKLPSYQWSGWHSRHSPLNGNWRHRLCDPHEMSYLLCGIQPPRHHWKVRSNGQQFSEREEEIFSFIPKIQGNNFKLLRFQLPVSKVQFWLFILIAHWSFNLKGYHIHIRSTSVKNKKCVCFLQKTVIFPRGHDHITIGREASFQMERNHFRFYYLRLLPLTFFSALAPTSEHLIMRT